MSSPALPAPLDGIAFDFNGVILDDEALHGDALAAAFAPRGVTITRELYWDRYLAYDDRGAIAKVIEDFPECVAGRDLATFTATVMREKIAHYMTLLDAHLPFFPGALDAVRAAAARWPLVVVSGARREEIETALALGGIADLFAGIVASDDCDVSKPDPEPYRRGAALLEFAPDRILAVEDSLGGLRSARAAGLRTLAVAHTYEEARLRPECDIVIPRIADLAALLSSSSD